MITEFEPHSITWDEIKTSCTQYEEFPTLDEYKKRHESKYRVTKLLSFLLWISAAVLLTGSIMTWYITTLEPDHYEENLEDEDATNWYIAGSAFIGCITGVLWGFYIWWIIGCTAQYGKGRVYGCTALCRSKDNILQTTYAFEHGPEPYKKSAYFYDQIDNVIYELFIAADYGFDAKTGMDWMHYLHEPLLEVVEKKLVFICKDIHFKHDEYEVSHSDRNDTYHALLVEYTDDNDRIGIWRSETFRTKQRDKLGGIRDGFTHLLDRNDIDYQFTVREKDIGTIKVILIDRYGESIGTIIMDFIA